MAVTGPIPAPPRVGQCLLQPPPNPAVVVGGGGSYRLGRCSASHYGEVAEVVDGTKAKVQTPAGLAYSLPPCADESAYLGWAPPVPARPQVRWRSIEVNTITMDPTVLQRAFGQHWVICVVIPSTPGASYRGSVKNALSTGRLPASYAQCVISLRSPNWETPCDQPHRYEIFGTAVLSDGYRDQRSLDADCLAIVRSSSGMADVTAAGALAVTAVPFHWDAVGDQQPGWPAVQADQAAEAVCAIGATGSRVLTGTLFGIGAHPLPWA